MTQRSETLQTTCSEAMQIDPLLHQNQIMTQNLKLLPVEELSKLMQREPSLEVSDDLIEKVYEYREGLEKALSQDSKDFASSREALASHLLVKDSDSDDSSDSDEEQGHG